MDVKHGVVVPGCPTCRKALGTVEQFVQHISDDVLPSLVVYGPKIMRNWGMTRARTCIWGKGDFMEDNNYLNEHAAKLRSDFPMCGGYITELLAKYKKALKEGNSGHRQFSR